MKKYNLLLPIAGKAQRFIDAGYPLPKPLIHVGGKQIIDLSLESIFIEECNLIFIVREDHVINFNIEKILKAKFGEDIVIKTIEKVTRGALETCYFGIDQINLDLPLIIYTPDVSFKPQFNPKIINPSLDGFLLTFKANSPDHSYVSLNSNGVAQRIAEKEVISENANVGLYYFKSGEIFKNYALEVINNNLMVKNEFYIAPVYNLLIRDKLIIETLEVEKMYVLGTPENLEFYENKVIKTIKEKIFVLSADHSGYELKEEAKKILSELQVQYIDVGTFVNQPCDYPDYMKEAIKSVTKNLATHSLSFCRTGQGMNIAANKHNEVISTIVQDEYTAEYAIRHNCSDFFSIPTKYVEKNMLKKIILTIIKHSFDGGRHYTRLEKALNG